MIGNFNIAAPFIKCEQIPALKRAGADELYCGYTDSEWESLWPSEFHTINRRGKGASFTDFGEFKESVKEAKNMNLPVFVTMNGLYTPEQYPHLFKIIDRISCLSGVKGLIVADMGFLLALINKRYKKSIHMSTGITAFNHLTVDFFGSLGAKRVVLDRQLTGNEIEEILLSKESSIEIEIFIFYTSCLFIDGYCSFIHCLKKTEPKRVKDNNYFLSTYDGSFSRYGCEMIRLFLKKNRFTINKLKKATHVDCLKYKESRYPFGCNLCSLFKLKDKGIITLKVIERGPERSQGVREISKYLKFLMKSNDKEECIKEARDVFSSFFDGIRF